MKDSIFYKLLKWILGGSAVSFFAILISVMLVIVSRYPDTLERAEIEFNRPWKEYYTLFSESTEIPLSKISIPTDTNKYCHILIIDRTLSTLAIKESKILKDSILGKELFGTSSSGSIFKFTKDDVFLVNKENKKTFEFTIQHYLMLRYYQKMACDDKIKGVIIGFFDGVPNMSAINFYNKNLGNRLYNHIPNKIDRENLITKLVSMEPLLIETKDQESDFRKMFNEINDKVQNTDSLQGKRIILTIISDFYHDIEEGNITDRDVAKFKRENQGKINQYNFIYCVPSQTTTKERPKENPKEKSKELVDKLFKEFEGSVNVVKISTEMFDEIEGYNQQFAFLNDVFLECLNPAINKKDSTIKFAYPKLNSQGIETSEARIQLSNNSKFKWRIETLPQYPDANFFISYSYDSDTVEKTKIHSLPQLEFQDATTDLHLEIETGMLNNVLKKRIRLKTISEENGNKVYGIHSFKFLETHLSPAFRSLAETILNGLCFLWILIFVSGTLLLWFYLSNKKYTSWCNWMCNFFGVISILVFSVYAAKCLLYPYGDIKDGVNILWLKTAYCTVLTSSILIFLLFIGYFIWWCRKPKTRLLYIGQIETNGNIDMNRNQGIDKNSALFELVAQGNSAELRPLPARSNDLTSRTTFPMLECAFHVPYVVGNNAFIVVMESAKYTKAGNNWSLETEGKGTVMLIQ